MDDSQEIFGEEPELDAPTAAELEAAGQSSMFGAPDPVMGWAGSGDTQSQVTLKFAGQADAVAYAEKYGIAAVVHPTPPRRLKIQAYADNFR